MTLVNIIQKDIFEVLKPSLLEEFYSECLKVTKSIYKESNTNLNLSTNTNTSLPNSNNLSAEATVTGQTPITSVSAQPITTESTDTNNTTSEVPVTDFEMLKNFVVLLTTLQVNPSENFFASEVEKILIQQSLELHKPKIEKVLSSEYDLLDFLKEGLLLIKQEETLCSKFLPVSTINTLKSELIIMIFFNNSKKIIEAKLEKELLSRNSQCLTLLYGIFKDEKKNSIQSINYIFKNYIKKEFTRLLVKYDSNNSSNNSIDSTVYLTSEDLAYNSDYVKDFYEFYTFHINLINSAFQGENIFRVSLNDVLEHIQLVKTKFNNAYTLSYYLDRILNKKRDNIGTSTNSNSNTSTTLLTGDSLKADISKKVSLVVDLFNSIPDKDIFIENYRKLLSRRLLNETFFDLDIEDKALQEFKVLGGANYTSNLFSMISDYSYSKTFQKEVCEVIAGTSDSDNKLKEAYFDSSDTDKQLKEAIGSMLEVKVLDKDKWPKTSDYRVHVPPSVEFIYSTIGEYYKSKNPNRHLEYDLENTKVELAFNLNRLDYSSNSNNQKIVLLLNGIQACILLSFNRLRSSKYSIHLCDLEKSVNLDKTEFYRNIKALLSKEILSKDSQDNILLNTGFSNSSTLNALNSSEDKGRIVVNSEEKQQEVQNETIETDRSYAIEAAIVRIMKKNPRLSHSELILKLKLEPFLFIPDNSSVKDKIENLIERGLIERAKESSEEYVYNY
eukprot:CAMPEP_0170519308 /NCGR_PEP_ID=MMETSP0209-20121228/4777_1 /TAXON_ID=665100 ORGANISM="Litonotus pictus, Strain P1" /NCGR_SAMPLE_ID=MMETSP0209 /ASSEMBLY_ACC=CAM_ASM_000301 /LENGTH=726 /DNA_ID=CAMNT_0010805167 /DNA_START=390 /DNA_END=2570 /DNA_ORIENTATION=+